MNRLAPVPACDALVYNLPADEHANGTEFVGRPESKDEQSKYLAVLQQPPLDPEWARANCELYDLLPIAMQLNHRTAAFPSIETMEQACEAYKSLISEQHDSESKLELLNDSVLQLLFPSNVCLDIDGVLAASLRDYLRMRTRDNDHYARVCLNSKPRVPGSIFGEEANSLDNILWFLKLCKARNSKSGASMVNVACHLVTMVAMQAWHVINGRYLVYQPAPAQQQQQQQQQNSEVKTSSASVLFDNSKPPVLLMSFRQRDFVLHDIIASLVRGTTGRQSKKKRETKQQFDASSLVVEEGDLQTIARHTSLSTFIFLVLRCVARIAEDEQFDMGHLFSMKDSLKWCRDQLGKNVVLFLDTLHFREMPVKDTVELFNQLTRKVRGTNGAENRLLWFSTVRWSRTRLNPSVCIKPLTFPDKNCRDNGASTLNPYSAHVPQFFYHLFNGPNAPVLPATPSGDRQARLGAMLWALSLHSGSVMRSDVLKHVREGVQSKEEKLDVGGGEDESEVEGKVAAKPASTQRGKKRKDDNIEEATQNKRRRVGTKQASDTVFINRKIRPISWLSSGFGKYRPVLSPIRRRYCFLLGPGDVLFASPPATFFVDDPINDGIDADEASVYYLTPTIIRCLMSQGTDQHALLDSAIQKNATPDGNSSVPPHYSALLSELARVDLVSQPVFESAPTSAIYKTYLGLSSVLRYEADVIVSLKSLVDNSIAVLAQSDPLSPQEFITALIASYGVYLSELQKHVELQDMALGGIFNALHDVMRTSWPRSTHVSFSALRSATEPASSGPGFGILKLDAMEKLVADLKTELKIAFVHVNWNPKMSNSISRSFFATPRDDVSAQLAMALVNRHPPAASELENVYVTDVQEAGSGILNRPAMEFFHMQLLHTHLQVVVPCLLYVSIKCPAPIIMHNSTSAAKIPFGSLPAPKVRSATESAMMELATKHTASFANLLTSPSFVSDVHAMTDIPDKLKPALQFLFLSAPPSTRTAALFNDVRRLMGHFGRSPADVAQQMEAEDGLSNSAQQITKGHIKHATVGSRDLSFFAVASDSKFQPVRPDVMFDGAQLLKLCQQGTETVAFWQVLQSFIGSIMDTRLLAVHGLRMNVETPRVLSIPIIEAAYIRLAADPDVPLGYTLRPPSDRLMDVLHFLWLAITDAGCRKLFIRILVDTASSAKGNPRVASSPDLKVFFIRLKAKLSQFESAPHAVNNNNNNSSSSSNNSNAPQSQPQPQPQLSLPASTSLVHVQALLSNISNNAESLIMDTGPEGSVPSVPADDDYADLR